MTPGRREMGTALALALLGAAGWWLQRGSAPPPPLAAPAERRPDYVVEQLDAVVMDGEGRPDRRLTTPELRHYPDDGSSELSAPRLMVYAEDGPPWHARSDAGWLNATGNELLMEDNVRIERAALGSAPPLLLRTSELLILPETEYAETARFAEIERGEDWVTAEDGMRVWFGDQMRAKLFGRVRARQRVVDPGS